MNKYHKGFTLISKACKGFTLISKACKGFTLISKACKGFTLIELLVVLAILGIVSVIGLGSFRNAQERSRDARRKSDLNNIAKALEVYYNDNQRYPASNNTYHTILACPAAATQCAWGSGRMTDSSTNILYMEKVPADPKNYTYYYRSSSTGKAYQLYAHLENTTDPNCINSNCTVTQVGTIRCGSTSDICNFAITSPNTNPSSTPTP